MIRLLAVLVILSALFFASVANAEPPKAVASPPEEVAEADLLRVQNLELKAELIAHDAADAKRAYKVALAEMWAKYKLSDADTIDGPTRQIRRAPKPTPTPKK